MSMIKDSGKSIIVSDATFFWAKLNPSKPVDPFGTKVWEVAVHLDKKDKQIPELEAEGVVFKEDKEKGTMYFQAKRKAEKPDGTANTPVLAVDTEKQPVDASLIGNGTTGKVKLWRFNWEHKSRKGTSFTLQAVQVKQLVQYKTTGGIVDIFADDEVDDGLGGTVKVPASAKAKAAVVNDDF